MALCGADPDRVWHGSGMAMVVDGLRAPYETAIKIVSANVPVASAPDKILMA